MSQLECDCSAAEKFEWVPAVCLGRVEYGNRFGDTDGVVGEMVVGDDQVHPEDFCFFGGDKGPDTGVNTDDKSDAGGGRLYKDAGLHAVAFAQTVGDVVGDDGGFVFGGDPFDGGF